MATTAQHIICWMVGHRWLWRDTLYCSRCGQWFTTSKHSRKQVGA